MAPPSRSGRTASSDPAHAARRSASRVVVGEGEAFGLAAGWGGYVGPGQPVQPLQEWAGVGNVAADGGVAPAGVAVSVRTACAVPPGAQRP